VKTTYTVTQAQAKLPTVVRECAEHTITITRRDEPVAYVISREKLESLFETMEILNNPKAMEVLNKDRAGKLKYYPLDSLDED
jgi:prevent-host-death family protein